MNHRHNPISGTVNRIYDFNRGLVEPLNSILRFVNKFEHLHIFYRLIILAAIAILLAFQLYRFTKSILIPQIKLIAEIHEETPVYAFIYFDFLSTIVLIIAVIFILCMVAGSPGLSRRLPLIKSGHPIITFCLYTTIIYVALKYIPGLVVLGKFVAPHESYVGQVKLAAFCFGLSLADVAAKPKPLRWWTLIFIIPFPTTAAFPLLWWNVAQGWAPSRIWIIWKPILLGASCLMPILFYPTSQPILPDLPRYNQKNTRVLDNELALGCYGIERTPGRSEIYARCIPSLCRFEKKKGIWGKKNCQSETFQFNEAAIDYQKGAAYLYDGEKGNLHAYSIPSLIKIKKTKIPVEDFPVRMEIYHTCFNGEGQIIIGENDGALGVITGEIGKLNKMKFLSRADGQIHRILCLVENNEMLLLQANRLSLYNTNTLSCERSVELPDFSYGMYYDSKFRKIYVGQPEKMEVLVYDFDTFDLLDRINAPAGVRAIGLDHQRGLLFFASFSSVVEVRDVNDFHLIKRKRLVPWVRDLEVMSDQGELIISGRVEPVVWKYEMRDEKSGFFERLMFLGEKIIKFALSMSKKEKEVILDLHSKTAFKCPETGLLGGLESGTVQVCLFDDVQKRMAMILLSKVGYDVRSSNNPDECINDFEREKEVIGAIIIDGESLLKMRNSISAKFYQKSLIAMFPPEKADVFPERKLINYPITYRNLIDKVGEMINQQK